MTKLKRTIRYTPTKLLCYLSPFFSRQSLLLILLTLTTKTTHCQFHQKQNNNNRRCEPIPSDILCKVKYYNTTSYPNYYQDQSITQANQRLSQLYAILKPNDGKQLCHSLVKLFFCTAYVPPCVTNNPQNNIPLRPCKEFCKAVHNKCKRKFRDYRVDWPPELSCSQLPEEQANDDTKNGRGFCVPMPKGNQFLPMSLGDNGDGLGSDSACRQGPLSCPASLELNTNEFRRSISMNRYTFSTTRNTSVINCGAPCNDGRLFWSGKDRTIARISIAVASAISILSTGFAIATYLTDQGKCLQSRTPADRGNYRFRYPEKPIIYLAICYFCISIAYLLGALTPNMQIACTDLPTGKTQSISRNIVAQGTDNTDCTLVFMLLYFFQISSGVWWVILALTWLLAAGLKWSSEAIERISQYFHFGAWGLPTILTLVILSQGKVDGDSLSGVCFTGQLDSDSLWWFVFLPMVVCLIAGSICLVVGFVALFKIRQNFKRNTTGSGLYQSNNSGPMSEASNQYDYRVSVAKLEALMLKIGMFSIGYFIPACIVLGCYYYETQEYDQWVESWMYKMGQKPTDNYATVNYCSLSRYDDNLNNPTKEPKLWVFIIKYLVQLFLGTICGLWVWSMKTLNQWFTIFGCGQKLSYNGQQPEVQTYPLNHQHPQQVLHHHHSSDLPHQQPLLTQSHGGGGSHRNSHKNLNQMSQMQQMNMQVMQQQMSQHQQYDGQQQYGYHGSHGQYHP